MITFISVTVNSVKLELQTVLLFSVYRESRDDILLQRAADAVQAHFSTFPDFYPVSILIVTWDNVVPYGGDNSAVSILLVYGGISV